jgi:hypothetical protein
MEFLANHFVTVLLVVLLSTIIIILSISGIYPGLTILV